METKTGFSYCVRPWLKRIEKYLILKGKVLVCKWVTSGEPQSLVQKLCHLLYSFMTLAQKAKMF